ncbi:hypothetical protein AOA80_00130 [Methanomassiliicoccales archaeon RumEn M1]|jgi:hypothetical protein|nr:hypothetical protein AOA80_00130 [Methanomassiliicoccales archaeon RumEn M1]
MEEITKEELEEAIRAIASTIGKCEKVLPKLKEGTSQHTLLARRIKAFRIAIELMERELVRLHHDDRHDLSRRSEREP